MLTQHTTGKRSAIDDTF